MAICIEKVAGNSTVHIAAPVEEQHQQFHVYIQEATNEQQRIGWFHLLRGFLSNRFQKARLLPRTLQNPVSPQSIPHVHPYHVARKKRCTPQRQRHCGIANLLRRNSWTPTLPLRPSAFKTTGPKLLQHFPQQTASQSTVRTQKMVKTSSHSKSTLCPWGTISTSHDKVSPSNIRSNKLSNTCSSLTTTINYGSDNNHSTTVNSKFHWTTSRHYL